MRDLRELNANVELGSWSGQLPSLNRSYNVQNKTAEKIEQLSSEGYTIVVGNHHSGAGIMVSQINSRFHGRSIRTIRAI